MSEWSARVQELIANPPTSLQHVMQETKREFSRIIEQQVSSAALVSDASADARFQQRALKAMQDVGRKEGEAKTRLVKAISEVDEGKHGALAGLVASELWQQSLKEAFVRGEVDVNPPQR